MTGIVEAKKFHDASGSISSGKVLYKASTKRIAMAKERREKFDLLLTPSDIPLEVDMPGI